MLSNLLATIICQTFEKVVGRDQAQKPNPKALLVSFTMPLDYDNEEGYRYLDIAIYAPMNYVGVFVRERWNVIPLEDLEDDGEDTVVKPGKSYNKGASEWRRLGYHDSGWRSLVQDVISKHGDKLGSFDSMSDFYKVIDPTPFVKET